MLYKKEKTIYCTKKPSCDFKIPLLSAQGNDSTMDIYGFEIYNVGIILK